MNLLPSACFLPQLTVSDWSVGSAVSNLRRPDTLASVAACALRGGSATSEVVPEIADLVTGAYDWCINLGAPSALVAGAVVATIYEAMSSGNLDLDPDDTKWVALGKKLTRMLLLTAFAFETISIFVTTVTGTMLMSRPPHSMVNLASVTTDTTPLSFLSDNFEFEYLTSRITFLQGLLNWLAAIGMAHVIPNGESVATRKMNMFIASMLFTAIFVMLAFYNAHMDFHPNYFGMLCRWTRVTWLRFFWRWPPRPLLIIVVPLTCSSAYWGCRALLDEQKGTDDKVLDTQQQTEILKQYNTED